MTNERDNQNQEQEQDLNNWTDEQAQYDVDFPEDNWEQFDEEELWDMADEMDYSENLGDYCDYEQDCDLYGEW